MGVGVLPHVTRAPTEFSSTQICFISRPVCLGAPRVHQNMRRVHH